MLTYIRRSMFLFFALLCLLNTRCDSIQSDETEDQSAEHKRLLLNDPQAMNDRLIDLERKLQAVNGDISSLKKENSLLKSTVANVGMFYSFYSVYLCHSASYSCECLCVGGGLSICRYGFGRQCCRTLDILYSMDNALERENMLS